MSKHEIKMTKHEIKMAILIFGSLFLACMFCKAYCAPLAFDFTGGEVDARITSSLPSDETLTLDITRDWQWERIDSRVQFGPQEESAGSVVFSQQVEHLGGGRLSLRMRHKLFWNIVEYKSGELLHTTSITGDTDYNFYLPNGAYIDYAFGGYYLLDGKQLDQWWKAEYPPFSNVPVYTGYIPPGHHTITYAFDYHDATRRDRQMQIILRVAEPSTKAGLAFAMLPLVFAAVAGRARLCLSADSWRMEVNICGMEKPVAEMIAEAGGVPMYVLKGKAFNSGTEIAVTAIVAIFTDAAELNPKGITTKRIDICASHCGERIDVPIEVANLIADFESMHEPKFTRVGFRVTIEKELLQGAPKFD